METKKTAVVLATVATMAVAPGAAFAAGAQADSSTVASDAANGAVLTQTVGANWATPIVQEQTVEGAFSFSQATVTPIEKIRAVFQKAVVALCGADDELTVANAADWSITVGGDVQAGYSATLGELAQDDENTTIMGCACVSNGAGGPAAINAQVTGIPLAGIIKAAQPNADANTVTFVSEDGYNVSLPLDYVLARHSVISYEINGETLSSSMGGTNQLWIDSAAAKYFTRNIVEIRVTHEDVVPAAPGSEQAVDGEYVNRPNVGIADVR